MKTFMEHQEVVLLDAFQAILALSTCLFIRVKYSVRGMWKIDHAIRHSRKQALIFVHDCAARSSSRRCVWFRYNRVGVGTPRFDMLPALAGPQYVVSMKSCDLLINDTHPPSQCQYSVHRVLSITKYTSSAHRHRLYPFDSTHHHLRQLPLFLYTMNSLYTLGVRQTNSIQADLERLRNGEKSASLLGL